MFTGIVEELGTVADFRRIGEGASLRISASLVMSDLAVGDSVAVNGVCLAAVALTDADFTADVMGESLDRTTLGGLAAGDRVNLERALRLHDRLGGHIVQGHVDGTGTVLERSSEPYRVVLRVSLPQRLSRYVADKGSVAVDGTSLTVVEVGDGWFTVALIPETLEKSTLGWRQPGDQVNVEADMLVKHLERMTAGLRGAS